MLKLANTEMDYGNLCSVSSEAHSLKITWKIPKYLSLPYSSLDSSPFIFANATWCLRLDLNRQFDISVSLKRLHSLMKNHRITCMFDVLKGNGEHFKDEYEQEYRPLVFHVGNREEERYVIKISNSSELVSVEKMLTPDGTLVLVSHLLFEESAEEDNLQKCRSDNTSTNMYINGKMERKPITQCSLTFSNVQSLKITWEVPKYQPILENALGYSLNSPSFDFGYATWFLKLYPVGVEENESGTGLSIVRSRSLVPLYHEIIYTLDVSTKDEPFRYIIFLKYKYKKISFNEDSKMKESRQEFFDTRTKIVDCLASDGDGNVTFFIYIFYEEASVKDAAVQKMLDELNMYRTFGGDLKNFLFNGSGHDLILRAKEKEFRVHRQILSAHSPVFQSMLTYDMMEKNCGVVDIPDCDPPAIEQFILYVYCGKMDSLDESNVLGLYYMADKYEMMHLKEVCRGLMQKSLSPRNVCDIGQLSMKHSDEELVEFVIEFFVKYKNEILSTAEWVSFMDRDKVIANEILNKVSVKVAGQKRNSLTEDSRKEDNL